MKTILFTGSFEVGEDDGEEYEVGQDIEITDHVSEVFGCTITEVTE